MQSKLPYILFAVLVILLCACGEKTAGINPASESNLGSATMITVYDLYTEGEGPVIAIENASEIQEVVAVLDANHPVTPKTFCAPRYNLRFHFSDGNFVDIQYFCDDNAPFIRSNLEYFENEDYAVSEKFIELIDQKVAASSFDEQDYKPGSELANPASVYCEEQGGVIDMRTDESGGQYGVCIFGDGSECEEWAYFRGECEPGE